MEDVKIRDIKGKEFRRLQLIQLDMLVELDRVCRANNIRYCIFFGSLLGAVRHKGYIPWDDDADICMLREDYEKFKTVIDQLDPEICFFQDHETDPGYIWGYGKLRRTGTTFIRAGQEHMKGKTGVFVDIFPMDDAPLSLIGQMWRSFRCIILRKILWSQVGKFTDKNAFKRGVFSLMSHIKPATVYKRTSKMEKKSKNDSPNRVRVLLFPTTYRNKHKICLERYSMPKSWFTERAEYDFEGAKLFSSRDYDAALKYNYGDYMVLPPDDKREPHAPVSEYSFGDLRSDV